MPLDVDSPSSIDFCHPYSELNYAIFGGIKRVVRNTEIYGAPQVIGNIEITYRHGDNMDTANIQIIQETRLCDHNYKGDNTEWVTDIAIKGVSLVHYEEPIGIPEVISDRGDKY